MFLRRLRHYLKEQNLSAAGLEMIVVILSIIIGLGFSNWNEERLENLEGDRYLARIADELEQDIRFFEGVLRMNERSIENAEFLLQTIENENLVREDPSRFITSLSTIGASIVVNVNNNTFEEIKFSGKLDQIENEELRNQIADYYDFIEVSQTFNHLRINAEIGYQNRYAGILAPEQYGQFGRDIEYSEVDALLVYERFLEDEELIEWIPILIGAKRGTIGFSTRSQQNAKNLLATIRGETAPEVDETEDQAAN